MRICVILLGCLLVLSPYWQAYSEPITEPQKEESLLSYIKTNMEEFGSQVPKYFQSGINYLYEQGKDGWYYVTISKEEMVPILSATKTVAKDLADKTVDKLPIILPILSQTQWLKYLETITASAATKFDKALDAKYLQTALGGGNHRMFDGGHTLGGAWSNIAGMCAKTGCSSREQVNGYFEALLKDWTTPKGLPFMTMEKQTYDSIADSLKRYGINKNWTYDALSYDALEVLAAGISAAVAVYFLKTEQIEELSEALGAMGVVSVLGLVMISSVAYAIATGVDLNAKDVAKGVAKTSVISGALVLLPTVFLLQITTAVALSILLEKGMTKKNYLFAKNYRLEKTLRTWGFGIRGQVINTFVEKVKTLKTCKFYLASCMINSPQGFLK